MDLLDAMAVLVAVSEAGSLSAGARVLAMPLPTVSRKMSELEAQLGTKLLLRTVRGLSLTDSGQAYLASCKRILEQIAEAERTARGEYHAPKGELIVTAPVAFGRLMLLPVISEFLAAYPQIDLQLVLGDRNLKLVDEHIDLALRIGALPDSTLMSTRVGEVRRVVCCSPAYLAQYGLPQVPADLAQHRCVHFAGLGADPLWQFAARPTSLSTEKGEGRAVVIETQARLTVNTAEAAIDAAASGVGLTRVLSYQAAAALKAGQLKRVLQAYELPALPVSLLFSGQGPLPLKLRAFLDFVKPRLRTALEHLAAELSPPAPAAAPQTSPPRRTRRPAS